MKCFTKSLLGIAVLSSITSIANATIATVDPKYDATNQDLFFNLPLLEINFSNQFLNALYATNNHSIRISSADVNISNFVDQTGGSGNSVVAATVENAGAITFGSKEQLLNSVQLHAATTEKEKIAIGIKSQRVGANVEIYAHDVDISAESSDYYAYGIYTPGFQSVKPEDPSKTAQTKIVADRLNIEVSAPEGNNNAIIAWSTGIVDLEANDINIVTQTRLTDGVKIGTGNLINTRGQATVNINAKEKGVLLGDVIFAYNGTTSGTDVDAFININLTGTESYWQGNSSIVFEKSNVSPFSQTVKNFKLSLSNGARWITSENSFVNTLTLNQGILRLTSSTEELRYNTLLGTTGEVRITAEQDKEGNIVSASKFIHNTEDGYTATYKKENVYAHSTFKQTTSSVQITSTFLNLTADQIKDNQSALSVLANNIDGATLAVIDEGEINGTITAEVKDGKVVAGSTIVHQNEKLTDFMDVNSIGFSLWRNDIEHVSTRLGDIRHNLQNTGAWVRVTGGEVDYKDSLIETDTFGFQVGADTRVADWVVGGSISYTDTDSDIKNGEADGYLFGLGGYALKTFDNGAYIDLSARYGYVSQDVKTKGVSMDSRNHGLSLGVESGHMFKLSPTVYVEPQAQLTYGFLKGDDLTSSSGVKIQQDDMEYLVGRIGVRTGINCPANKGGAYLTVSYNYDFLGEVEGDFYKDSNHNHLTNDLGGGWLSFGLGAQYNINEQFVTYGEFEHNQGGEVENPWRVSVGIRYAF